MSFAEVRHHLRQPEYGTLLWESKLNFSGALNFRRVARMAPYNETVFLSWIVRGFLLNDVLLKDIDTQLNSLNEICQGHPCNLG